MKIFKNLVEACSREKNKNAKTFLIKAGFMEYMTNRWRKNFNGQITIFCSLDKDIEFSANYSITTKSGVKKQGSIPPQKMSAQNYEYGLETIVEKIQKEID